MRVIGPATTRPPHISRSGAREIRPRWGLSPNRPVTAEGMRIDPAPSVPIAAAASPAATAAADPPLEPPGECVSDHGLRVGPAQPLSV